MAAYYCNLDKSGYIRLYSIHISERINNFTTIISTRVGDISTRVRDIRTHVSDISTLISDISTFISDISKHISDISSGK